MHAYEGNNITELWLEIITVLNTDGHLQEGRDQSTKELLHVHCELSNPRNRYLGARPINPAFALAEVIWFMSGSDEVEPIAWWNSRMRDYSDDGVYLHGAYGSRLRRYTSGLDRFDQLESAYRALKDNKPRRDVVLQIWDSGLDLPEDKHPRAKDIPCNLIIHPLIRHGKLEFLVVARSNDAVWGVPYNVIQFTTIQEILAGWLGIDVGTYVWISDSLHVYQRHFEDLESILNSDHEDLNMYRNQDNTDDLRLPWDEYREMQELLETAAFGVFPEARDTEDVMDFFESIGPIPIAYRNILRILAAETLRKLGLVPQAINMVDSSTNYILRSSWLRWKAHKENSK
ncbi:MAG: thymidylate synthase [Candidatus Thorarchaeota archaeon]|jgi:thymidylate synthase